MDKFYYDAVDRMEKDGVDRQYIDGWMCGYLHNPKRGPQHTTAAYEAGYVDGMSKLVTHFDNWHQAA
jgi:hypothetical protein